MRPRFSVVIPTRDSADSISRTLVGVLSQTFAGLEIVVADAASSDETIDVVDMLADSRVRVLRVDPSGDADRSDGSTVGEVRSAGFAECGGRWAATLDPGDEVDPTWLSRMGRLADHAGATFVSCGGTQRFADLSETTIPPIDVPGIDDVSACLRSGSFIAPTAYFRRLSPRRLSDLVTAGITMIESVRADGRSCVSTPEELVRWNEGPRVDADTSEEERRLSRLMAALETLALTPIPDGELLARYAAAGGEAAVRLGRRADARKLFGIARAALPTVPQYWFEWAGTLIPFRSGPRTA